MRFITPLVLVAHNLLSACKNERVQALIEKDWSISTLIGNSSLKYSGVSLLSLSLLSALTNTVTLRQLLERLGRDLQAVGFVEPECVDIKKYPGFVLVRGNNQQFLFEKTLLLRMLREDA